MKKSFNIARDGRGISCSLLALFGFLTASHAQNSGPTNGFAFPIVTVRATNPLASWTGDTGTFTFFRTDPTNATLNVYYRIDGTASNGVDYAQISNWVMLPAGVRSSDVTISPINKGQTGTKLAPSPTLQPVNYDIGVPSNAVVFIQGTNNTGTNFPPLVRISTPTNGATFTMPVNIPICADVRDSDGFVATVEFFANGTSIGIRTNNPYSAGPANPFCLLWSPTLPGDFALTAKATDNLGAMTTSDPVMITVKQGPPPTNQSPVVRIISPANGTTFRAPLDIPIFAFARDPDGTVTSVEFFAGTNDLGPGKPGCVGVISATAVCPSNIFGLIWSNPPPGIYPLTAAATDNEGASTVSDRVIITILPVVPPPTNRPPVLSITAMDPIAIEGTNCWTWRGLTNSTPTWNAWSPTACRSFTNCGPKNAIFAVHRFGATNDSLTVAYNIGGTATNGVDYVTLPGLVTIPAGQRRALITVVPIDDGPPDINSTVVLKLKPSAGVPPDYLLGYPASAAAIIIDSDGPQPVSGVLADRCFHVNAAGPNGAWFRIDYSTNLRDWAAVCTAQVVNGSIDFVDPDAASDQTRFYRAVPQMDAPLE